MATLHVDGVDSPHGVDGVTTNPVNINNFHVSPPAPPVWVFPDNEIDINARISSDTWHDVDVSSDVPAGTKAVILHCRNINIYGGPLGCNVRYNGATDNRTNQQQAHCHTYLLAPLDGSYIFDGFFDAHGYQDIRIVAYTSEDTFLTASQDLSLSTLDAYTNVDITSYVSGSPTGVFLELVNDNWNDYIIDLRPDGTSYSNYLRQFPEINLGLVGLTSKIFEAKISGAAADMFMWGYTTHFTAITPTIVTFSNTDQWSVMDCSLLVPVGTVGVVVRINLTGAAYASKTCGVRKPAAAPDDFHLDGSTPALLLVGNWLGDTAMYAFVGVDTNRHFEAYSTLLTTTYSVVGYITP